MVRLGLHRGNERVFAVDTTGALGFGRFSFSQGRRRAARPFQLCVGSVYGWLRKSRRSVLGGVRTCTVVSSLAAHALAHGPRACARVAWGPDNSIGWSPASVEVVSGSRQCESNGGDRSGRTLRTRRRRCADAVRTGENVIKKLL